VSSDCATSIRFITSEKLARTGSVIACEGASAGEKGDVVRTAGAASALVVAFGRRRGVSAFEIRESALHFEQAESGRLTWHRIFNTPRLAR
jgi:hypothetical protein